RAQQAARRLQLGGEYADHGLIFAGTLGQPLDWQNLVTRSFRPLRDRLALRLAGLAVPPRPPTGAGRPIWEAWRAEARAMTSDALRVTGLARMRPYDLRHSAATLLLAAGEHPKIVSELLGHAKVTLTLDTY